MNRANGIIAVDQASGGYGIYVGNQAEQPLFTFQAVEHLGRPGIDIRLHLSPLCSVNQIVPDQTLIEHLEYMSARGSGLTIVRFDPLMNEAIVGYTSFHEYQGISFERYCESYRIRVVVMDQVFLVTVNLSTMLMVLRKLSQEADNE